MITRVNTDGVHVGLCLNQSGDTEGVRITLVLNVGLLNEIECVATLTSSDVVSLVYCLQEITTSHGARHVFYCGHGLQLEVAYGRSVLEYKIGIGGQVAYVDAPTLVALRVGLEHILANMICKDNKAVMPSVREP